MRLPQQQPHTRLPHMRLPHMRLPHMRLPQMQRPMTGIVTRYNFFATREASMLLTVAHRTPRLETVARPFQHALRSRPLAADSECTFPPKQEQRFSLASCTVIPTAQ
jgi:hypothetical protein